MIKEDVEVNEILLEDVPDEKIQQVEMAKKIIKKYVSDRFSEKIDISKFEEILDDIKVSYYSEDDFKGGFYIPVKSCIQINEYLEKISFRNVMTIIHEYAHYLSSETMNGKKISHKKFNFNTKESIKSKYFEEGMADNFAEECINNYIQNASQEDLGKLEIDSKEECILANSAYDFPREFVKSTLEIIRQVKGNAYDTEYEWYLGDKSNFIQQCKEVLGEEFIELYEETKKVDQEQLGNHNLKVTDDYTTKLSEIIEGLQLDLKNETKRDDGCVNTYSYGNNLIQNIIFKQERNHIIEEFSEKAIEQAQLQEGNIDLLLKLKEQITPQKRNTINNEKTIEILAGSKAFTTIDLIKFIGSFDSLENEQMKKYSKLLDLENLSTENLENIDSNSRHVLLTILMQTNEPNENLLKVVDMFESNAKKQSEQTEVEITDDEKLLFLNCKYVLDKNEKGKKITQMLEILQDKSSRDIGEIKFEIQDKFQSYLNEEAKNDVQGKESIINFFANHEGKKDETQGIYTDVVSNLYKDIYYKRILDDFDIIACGMRVDPKFVDEVKSKNYSGDGKYILSNILSLKELSEIQRQTVLLKPFNKNTVKDVIGVAGIGSDFVLLPDEQKEVVLDTLEEMIKEPNSLENMNTIMDYTDAMFTDENNQEIAKKKEEFLHLISGKVEQREQQLKDILDLFEWDEKQWSESKKYIGNILINKMAQNIEKQNTEGMSIEGLLSLIDKSKNVENIENIEKIARQVLTEQISRQNLITGDFAEMANKYYNNDPLIQSYLQSIGKDGDLVQKNLLENLLYLNRKKVDISNPQYVEFLNQYGKNEQVILLDSEDGIMPYSSNSSKMECNQKFLEEQNRGKKGIASIFKNQKAKEAIEKTIVVEELEEEKESKVLNIYETGRMEIAILSSEGKKIKVINSEDIEPLDIGNNSLLTTKEKDIQTHETEEKDSQIQELQSEPILEEKDLLESTVEVTKTETRIGVINKVAQLIKTLIKGKDERNKNTENKETERD